VILYLLDTNVLTELRRPRPAPLVQRFIADQPLEALFVSSVTFAEIRFGIERVADPAHRAELHE
jgi:predicted nucleic acid-binding protein